MKTKYLLAICPPQPTIGIMDEMRLMIDKFLQPENALPPHIEVVPEFFWKDSEEYLLVHQIKTAVQNCYSQVIEIADLVCDKENELIYAKIESNEDLNQCIQGFVNKITPSASTEPFSNIKIAHRDLEKGCVVKAWNKIKTKEIHGGFLADKMTLFKHNGESWESKYVFDLD
ncbi:MAG: hypothetical protein ACOVP1_03600 [Bacteroidia bacterium]